MYAFGRGDGTIKFRNPETRDMRGPVWGISSLITAIDFCKEQNYERVFFWTFSTLMAARHLYAGKGFQIT